MLIAIEVLAVWAYATANGWRSAYFANGVWDVLRLFYGNSG